MALDALEVSEDVRDLRSLFYPKKGVPFDTPFFTRVRNAETESKFDFDAFMSFANDRYLALLCPMFANNAILCAMTLFSNILVLLLKPSLLCRKPFKSGIQSIADQDSY